MKKLILIFIFPSLACLFPALVSAEVISSASNGFAIRIERETDVNALTAYQQFIRIGEWWNGDHTWFGDAENLSIEARAGGCFCEKSGDKEMLHMTVSFVNPGKEIKLIGGLGPLQMMGVQGGMSWQFIDLENSESKIVQQYQVTGYSKEGLDKLAAIVDKVQTLQQEGLVARLNTRH